MHEHIHEFRDVFNSDLPFLLMLHLGMDGFEMLLPDHLHLETGLLPAMLTKHDGRPRQCT
jgi:hypothetical protein